MWTAISTVVLSACTAWLVIDLKCKKHLFQINQMLDTHLKDLEEIHERLIKRINQKYK